MYRLRLEPQKIKRGQTGDGVQGHPAAAITPNLLVPWLRHGVPRTVQENCTVTVLV